MTNDSKRGMEACPGEVGQGRPERSLLEVLRGSEPAAANDWGRGVPVEWSPDLERILALPRRIQGYVYFPDAAYASVIPVVRRPGGNMALRIIQLRALHEAQLLGGLIAAIGVGEGKTLISLLLPTVLDSKVAVLLVPAGVKGQLLRNYVELVKHWRINQLVGSDVGYADQTGVIHVVTYEALSNPNTPDILEQLNPDLVVADEVHKLRHMSAAKTKRFNRFFRKRPDRRFCGLSGTLITDSIRDILHLDKFALRDGSPTPLDWMTGQRWADALDPVDFPCPPGELVRLCEPGENVRSGFRRRLLDTPGVVATTGNTVKASLVLHRQDVKVPKVVDNALKKLREDWEIPGEEITDALAFSRYARQLSAGLYLRWTWPRGEPLDLRMAWLESRRAWTSQVRSQLKLSIPGRDSPGLCARAAESGVWSSEAWAPWRDIKDECKPQTEEVWLSDFLVQSAVAWGKKHHGIIWYEHPALGVAISHLGGFPFYGPGFGRELCAEGGSRTVVASRPAHGEGLNLQAFNKQLVTTASSSNKTWEQVLGRLHRSEQKADEVATWVYLHTTELDDAFANARNKARFAYEVKGEKQRLGFADYAF